MRNAYGKDMGLQAEASRRYRAKQAETRHWVSVIAEHTGMEASEFTTESNARLVAEILKTHSNHYRNET